VEGVGSGTIVDVRLVLSGSGEIGGYDPVSIVPGLWVDEVSATYTDLPTSGLTPATDSNWSPVFVPPVAGGDHARVDITTSITGDGVVTVVITGNPDTVAGFLSRESGNPPRLEITVQD
jgi:hypothetical protein